MDQKSPLPPSKKMKKKRPPPSCNVDDTASKPPSGNIISKSITQKAEIKSSRQTRTDNTQTTKETSGRYPYSTDYNDHFETPARAYDDIFPLLEYVLNKQQQQAQSNKSTKQTKKNQGKSNETTIYDPYYCAGRAAVLIRDVFKRHKSADVSSQIKIQHEKRDFYQDERNNTVPKYHILVTNPPYSGDHKELCLKFAVRQLKEKGRPFFLLMPNYVAMKEYFKKIVLEKQIQIFYITPSAAHPYDYDHPDGTGHQTSPFASVWFCGLRYTEGKVDVKPITDAFEKFHSSHEKSTTGMPQMVSNLQNLIRIGGVSAEKRKNPRQRRKIRQQAMQRADTARGSGSHVGATSPKNSGPRTKNHKRKSSAHGSNEQRNINKKGKYKK